MFQDIVERRQPIEKAVVSMVDHAIWAEPSASTNKPALVGLYFRIVFSLDWETISLKKSPDSKIVAYYLESGSEAGAAPYGDHIILASNYLPFSQYYGDTSFAAYCEGGRTYMWLNNHMLKSSGRKGK
jgi:hypothetical protein